MSKSLHDRVEDQRQREEETENKDQYKVGIPEGKSGSEAPSTDEPSRCGGASPSEVKPTAKTGCGTMLLTLLVTLIIINLSIFL